MEVVSYHNWSEFMYIDSWGFVVFGLFECTVLQNWPLYLVNVIQPAIIFEHFREYRSTIRTLGKKYNNNMVYLCTGFTMLPLHRNDGMEPKRRLAYADFYRMQIVAKKKKKNESGAKREGQSGFQKQDIFFFFFSFYYSLKFKWQRFIFLLLYFSLIPISPWKWPVLAFFPSSFQTAHEY